MKKDNDIIAEESSVKKKTTKPRTSRTTDTEETKAPVRRVPPKRSAALKKNSTKKTAVTKVPAKPEMTADEQAIASIADTVAEVTAPKTNKNSEKIFALDIGTRSVIGIVAEQEGDSLRILDTERKEHTTRAMLDGQIHDVPQVAAVIKSVKNILAERTGFPLRSAAVAAAGRALFTMTASAEMKVHGVISKEREQNLEFAGVQAAQMKLAASNTIDDPTSYYCVGYSTIKFELDGIQLKTLVGQRGKHASCTVIATFLPRQVIDSMQSALQATGLDMKALTLEPIAAINVLIPPTMRHLNLALVDIGAGTSDVAITKNGSVIAYGMVPLAGDEITEAISQKYLLDFNIAEEIKRNAAMGKNSQFTDILGIPYDLTPDEVLEPVIPNIQNLAGAISRQVLELNNDEAPQAIMLAGGGALTPKLQELVAETMKMPINRVAVSRPENITGILDLPDILKAPDAVTPLGIMKIASTNTLHFMRVYVNNQEYSLFNFREMTVSDALLSAGIQLRKLNGKPGDGIMVTIQGENKFFPGAMGTTAKILMNGEPADLDDKIEEESYIVAEPGQDGDSAKVTVGDITVEAPTYTVYLNGEETTVNSQWLLNGNPTEPETMLHDGDEITAQEDHTMWDFLKSVGLPPKGKKINYTLNGSGAQYTIIPHILLNDAPAELSDEVHPNDQIDYTAPEFPKLGQVLNISEMDSYIVIYYKDKEYRIKTAGVSMEINGHPASFNTLVQEGSEIHYATDMGAATTVSEALLAVGFQPPPPSSHMKFTIMVNNMEVSFTDPIKNKDFLDVILEKREERTPIIPVTEIKDTFSSTVKPLENTTEEKPEPVKIEDMIFEPQAEKEPEPEIKEEPKRELSMLERLGYSSSDVSKATEAAPQPIQDGINNRGYISPFSRFSSNK